MHPERAALDDAEAVARIYVDATREKCATQGIVEMIKAPQRGLFRDAEGNHDFRRHHGAHRLDQDSSGDVEDFFLSNVHRLPGT
jgi:hypothetical protein